MPRHVHGNAPFDDITDEAQARFEAHLRRTYRTDPQMPEVDQVWVDTTRDAAPGEIRVISVHPEHRIPYAEIDDNIYGRGQMRLPAFGRWLQLKEV